MLGVCDRLRKMKQQYEMAMMSIDRTADDEEKRKTVCHN